MTVVTIEKARDQLDDLVARAEAGEEIILMRAEKAAVRLEPIAHPTETSTNDPRIVRRPGRLAHLRDKIPDSFFDPLTEEELRLWEDGPLYPPERVE